MSKGIYALIPAAGKGTRLGLEVPKLLAPIDKETTVWSILRGKLLPNVDHIHLVVARQWVSAFEKLLANDPEAYRLSCSVQQEPRGMGDAIIGAYPHWAIAQTLLVVWGDQIHISTSTLSRALLQHRSVLGNHCTIPTVMLEGPYVQYCFDEEEQLTDIRETREGAVCDATGYSDVGTFVLEVAGLRDAWDRYSQQRKAGAMTGEVNFLPFLPYLARNGWPTARVSVDDPTEARGINSMDDLKFFQQIYNREAGGRSVNAQQSF
jgi:bifunctional UDP-N-acetylglucosamine pyrophosphorylase/glucosamine-1-phosphate N-acetyltransferase